MKIKKVAVLGAGAVGSYVIWGLSSRNDIELGVIAEGERAERLKQNGCTINGKIYHPEVWNSGETDAVDLLIVALKYGSLSAALESIQKVRLRRLPGVEVQYRHLRVILLCRIWMQEDTQRLICFQVH